MPSLVFTPRPTPVGFTATPRYHAESHAESVLIADFGSIPPEVNSARIYAGAGSDPLLRAAAMWDGLSADLYSAARSHHAVLTQLTAESWLGPASSTMMSATMPYLAWLHDTAELSARTAQHARAAVAAYEAARAMTVPPSVVAANRAQLAMLAAGNALGLDTHAIAAVDAQYREMWAQDSTAMYMYADTSANASNVTPFLPPPGAVGEVRAACCGTSSTIVQALRRLAAPVRIGTSSTSALTGALAFAKPLGMVVPVSGTVGRAAMTAGIGNAAAVGALSAPRGWLRAAAVSESAAPGPGAWSAVPITTTPAIPMMPVRSTAARDAGVYVPAARTRLRTVIRMRS